MPKPKIKHHALLQELTIAANRRNIEVRAEKLLREVGYRARSGRCRVNGREVIILDRDAPLADQIEFLSAVLAKETTEPAVTE